MFTGIAAVVLASRFWFSWYADLIRVAALHRNRNQRMALAVLPLLCCLALIGALAIAAARDVRESPFWILYYTVLGAAWVGMSMESAKLLGIDVRDDVLERRNSAALWVSLASLVSFTLCYAGGNIGEGPGAEAVVVSAGLATVCELALWLAFELCTSYASSERVTVDHDGQAAVRLCGMLLCNGVILGMAASGSWIPDDLIPSFAKAAWPALVVTATGIVVERSAALRRMSSAIPALYALIAGVHIWRELR